MNIAEWFGGFLILFNAAFFLVGWGIRLIMYVRCHKIRDCYSSKCRFRNYCDKKRMTKEEFERLRRLVEQYGE